MQTEETYEPFFDENEELQEDDSYEPDAETKSEIEDEIEQHKWIEKQSYEFNPKESSLLVEIYLPKKPEYQGALYDTLTDGFKKDNVEAHFRDADPDKKQRIKDMLARYYQPIADYTHDMIDRLNGLFDDNCPLFAGYSMYEVDGVFYDSEKRTTVEERSQVIRIIFKPHLRPFSRNLPESYQIELDRDTENDRARQFGTLRELTEIYFESTIPDRASFVKNNKELGDIQELFIDFLDRWVESVALFLFGYLVFNISERLLKLRAEGQGNGEEEEVWITSFWNHKLNRITFTNRVPRPGWEEYHDDMADPPSTSMF